MKTLTKLLVAAAFILPLVSISAPKALADKDNYGSIGYSQSTGAIGYSYDYPSESSAEARAVTECENYSHNAGDCEAIVWFANACGALATASDGAYGSGWGEDRSTAESYAIETCQDYSDQPASCSVVQWVCTTR